MPRRGAVTDSGHVLADDVRQPTLIADVEGRDDVGVVAQPTHRLGLAADALQAGLVQPFGLDHGDRHVPVQAGVVGEVDALAAALAQETLDLVTPAGEGGGERGGGRGRGRVGWGCGLRQRRAAGITELPAGWIGAAAGSTHPLGGQWNCTLAAERGALTVLGSAGRTEHRHSPPNLKARPESPVESKPNGARYGERCQRDRTNTIIL